jgi:hypothetical protein
MSDRASLRGYFSSIQKVLFLQEVWIWRLQKQYDQEEVIEGFQVTR